jgi:4-methylaminobutanoate oxidase (formaldehyde-forming)
MQSVAGKKLLPEAAKVVVIGGGIIGSSVAYHLAHMGIKDVIVLERDQLTSGTTWHAAGLMVTFGSTSETATDIRKYSKSLYQSLEEETGQSTGFKPVGFIELASEKDRLEEYRRVAAFNRACGVDVQEISPDEVKSLFPLCETKDILAGFYVEDDGRVNPVDATMALAKGARQQGAEIFEKTAVRNIVTDNGRVTGVETEDGGVVSAEYVVNCAGMWARQLGELSRPSVTIPNQAAEHYYLITDAIPEVDPDWPVIEDPSRYAYIRPEGGGLMVGLFEGEAAAWNVDSVPNNFSFGEIPPDWERMAPYLEAAMGRVPITLEVGAKNFFCGPESFTPDLSPLIGEAPEIRNYFVAAGMNSIGILSGGGIGRLVAHWIATGKPDVDVTGMNVDRVHKYQSNPKYRADRVTESLGRVYKTHYPTFTPQTARGAKRSPIHDRLEGQRACFKEVSGWESPDWFAPEGESPEVGDLSWNRHAWFPYWESEHNACRNNVALLDMSFMSKFLVQGKGAGAALNYLSTGNVDGDSGQIRYVQWLNDDGKMEADLTVAKLEEEKFMVVATDTAHRHVETWVSRYLDDTDGCHATITDVTGALAQINIQGPEARKLLQTLTSFDMGDESFPFLGVREIDIGYARVTVARITYLGELGYELYIPAEQAVHVYDLLVAAGQNFGMRHIGLRALSSLRLEKGYRDYGHDMDNTDTLLECGLGFTCDYEKEGGFRGRAAVLAQKEKGGLQKRMVQVLVNDPEPMMHHAEILYRDGVVVGDVRAASYGHTLGGSVGLAMVDGGEVLNKKYINGGKWEVDIAGKRYAVTVSLRPMYDAKNLKIKL